MITKISGTVKNACDVCKEVVYRTFWTATKEQAKKEFYRSIMIDGVERNFCCRAHYEKFIGKYLNKIV